MATVIPVDQLDPGDHACLTFTDAEERLDLLAAFVADGIDQGDKIICYTESVGVEELGDELRNREVPVSAPMQRGALRVVPSERAWAGNGSPDAEEMITHLIAELAQADREGYRGLRITVDNCWATRPQVGAEQLLAYESRVGRLFADGRLTAICQYDRQAFDPVTLAFAAQVHPRTVAATVYHEDPVLRICRQHAPPGVRVAGELDWTAAETFGGALAEAIRLDHDIHLNLTNLTFIDAGAAAVILQAAASLPDDRRMLVACQDPIDRTLVAAGAGDVPRLKMVVRHAQR